MKDPAFLFYSSDFLSGVQDLTMEERGQYITLLCLQHQKGHLTAKLIGLVGVAPDVLAKFQQDESGLYFNSRLDIEIEKRKLHSEKQRQKALDRWEKYKGNTKTDAAAYNSADAGALPLENENVIENENEDVTVIEKGGKNEKPDHAVEEAEVISILSFDEFWDMYDKKVGDKAKLKKKFEKIPEKERVLIRDHIPVYKTAQPDKQYRKNPETYLNNKSWNDEIISKNGTTTNRTVSKEATSWDELAQTVHSAFSQGK
jgi:hypothetical protein